MAATVVVARSSDLGEWAAIAVGQSIGALGAIAVALGWTVNGASLRSGDLFASGTISGPDPGSEGSLIELTSNGARPIRLGDGGERTFLEDGDELVLRGRAGAVELGEVRGTILPANRRRGQRA